jgi:hypothetical protein
MVLGMHRSGTSVLTGVLGLLGAKLPKEMLPVNATNPKGFFEPSSIVGLHDEMLSALGSSWADFRQLSAAQLASPVVEPFKAKILSALRSEYGDAATLVVKDPRICRFFPLWRDVVGAFGAEMCVIIVVRNPLEVTYSLAARDGLPRGYSLNLWLRHVLDAEFETRGSNRKFVGYAHFLRDWMQIIKTSEIEMGIRLSDRTPNTREAVEGLIDREMRHHVVDEEAFILVCKDTPLVLQAYHALERLIQRSDDAVAMKALDKVRRTFDEATKTLGSDIGSDLISVLRKLHLAESQILQLQAQSNVVGSLQSELVSAKARVGGLEKMLEERADDADRLNSRLQTQAEIIGLSQSALVLTEARVCDLEKMLEERANEADCLNSQLQTQENIIVSSQSELASAKTRTSDLEAMLVERVKEIAHLNGRLLTVQNNFNKVAAFRFLGRVNQEQKDNLELELSLMKRSLSWRLGKPLRTLVSEFPRVWRLIKRLFGL